jgi:N-acetylmuramoyl-L-alanine amidase
MNLMDHSPSPSRSQPQPSAPKTGDIGMVNSFYALQVIMMVAIVMATLFTAWESNSLRAGEFEAFKPASGTQGSQWSTATPHPRRIGVVAGHYGSDSGAVCADGLTEADLNLAIATSIQKELVAEGFEVDLLKEYDPRLAGYSALSLVFVHADSCLYINDLATGFKVAPASTTTQPDRSARLASCLRARYGRDTNLPFHTGSITIDMTDYHAFDEINPDTPAAIIETGFMNLDRQVLTEHQDRVAQGITDGILCYIYNENIELTPQP